MVDEALDFHVKATGRDGTQKRQELVNVKPGDLRRRLERWQARAKEIQRLQDKKKEQAWDLYRRVPNFRRKKKEDFVKDLERKAVYNGKIDEKRQTRCSPKSRQPRVNLKPERESGWNRRTPAPNGAEHGRSSGNQEPSPHRHIFLRFSCDSAIAKDTERGRVE